MIATKRNGRVESAAPTVRVAAYCRQSVTEGHDQAFGSIEAQRETVEAYVNSQRAQGWDPIPETYNDAGFSGGDTDRPAFQRLLADIDAGKVDVVAVYRLDRLSRSILDFARLMELFGQQGVTFVSVTEQFETATPMGRMVLNILATFAQFERESIAQRTKDKMLAARKRGMWTGGRPILGYDVVDRKLEVNEAEAERVRAIFNVYADGRTLLESVQDLADRGWANKAWTTKAGKRTGGRLFTVTSLHGLLTNPLYLGKIRAGDEICDGAHEPIVDQATWDDVQAQLEANRGRGNALQAGRPSSNGGLLSGIARCRCGAALSCTYTNKGSKRYAYYQCARHQKEGAKSCPGSRVAAGELEAFVVEQVRDIGRDAVLLEATLAADRADREARRPELQNEARRLAGVRDRLEGERRNILDAVAQGGGGVAVLTQRLGEIGEELGAIQEREVDVQRDLTSLERGAVDANELREALADLEPIWAELFTKERARVLGLLLESVEYDAEVGEVEIAFRPGGPGELRR